MLHSGIIVDHIAKSGCLVIHPSTTNAPTFKRSNVFPLFFETHSLCHFVAVLTFREAARLDPDCAMAYWGMALVLGPNINMPMPPEAEQPAHDHICEAVALKKTATEMSAIPWQLPEKPSTATKIIMVF